MKKLKIFLDSNVLIAGVASTVGASGTILGLTGLKSFEVYISKLIAEESEKNLRKKLPKFLPYYFYALKVLLLNIIDDKKNIPTKLKKYFTKKSDLVIFETVQKLKPDYFLTLNRKHFHQKAIKRIADFKIRTPAQFLDEWT